MSAVDKLLKIASAEIGYAEKASKAGLDEKTFNAGDANYTKYARDMDQLSGFYNSRKQGYPWCDLFVDWCFVQAFGETMARKLLCQPKRSMGTGCTSSSNYYKDKGQFFLDPEPGDQIFFYATDADGFGHTGIVEKVSGGKVTTIEGNTSDGKAVVANGGSVCRKTYA